MANPTAKSSKSSDNDSGSELDLTTMNHNDIGVMRGETRDNQSLPLGFEKVGTALDWNTHTLITVFQDNDGNYADHAPAKNFQLELSLEQQEHVKSIAKNEFLDMLKKQDPEVVAALQAIIPPAPASASAPAPTETAITTTTKGKRKTHRPLPTAFHSPMKAAKKSDTAGTKSKPVAASESSTATEDPETTETHRPNKEHNKKIVTNLVDAFTADTSVTPKDRAAVDARLTVCKNDLDDELWWATYHRGELPEDQFFPHFEKWVRSKVSKTRVTHPKSRIILFYRLAKWLKSQCPSLSANGRIQIVSITKDALKETIGNNSAFRVTPSGLAPPKAKTG